MDGAMSVLKDLSLRQVEKAVLKIESFVGLIPDQNTRHLRLNRGSDYDGYPFEDKVFLAHHPDPKEHYSDWGITLIYEGGATGDEFDYIKKAALDRSTGYKTRRSGPGEDTKFVLARCMVPQRPEHIDEAYRILTSLEKKYAGIETETATLEGWVNGGYAMSLLCREGCTFLNPAIISNQKLKMLCEAGHSLASLPDKLKCSSCGKTNPRMRPTV